MRLTGRVPEGKTTKISTQNIGKGEEDKEGKGNYSQNSFQRRNLETIRKREERETEQKGEGKRIIQGAVGLQLKSFARGGAWQQEKEC